MNPYLDNTIGILSDLTAFLYNNNVLQAVRVIKVKKGVNSVNIKVNRIKAKVIKVKAKVIKVKI